MSKKEVRMARQAALEAQRQRERRLRVGLIVGGVLIVVAVVGGLIVSQIKPGTTPAPNATAVAGLVATEMIVPDEGHSHVDYPTTVNYLHYPPSSGSHWASPYGPIEWRIYSSPERAEGWVHNLEHGGVVILYNCSQPCPDTVSGLKRLFSNVPGSKYGYAKLVIAPDPQIPTNIAAVAWNHELDLNGFDEKRLADFYKTWVDRGPEDAP